ncbi:MAG TPA: PIN domain-containing protein [Candidatus Paceibacterota bacterium]|jgi:hypothetical protein|nr:PIN domain-containing protein [Candidatus Paceibacterota bacterium]
MKKLKVIFDNNSHIAGKGKPILEIFSNNVINLKKFISKNNINERVSSCFTEIIKEEGIKELQRRVIARYHDVKKSAEAIKGIVPEDFISELNEGELKNKIEEQYDLKLKENNIEIIPLPSEAKILELSERALDYIPPFEIGDKGFKDTLIWLSILEDAEKNKDFDYIFVTGDKIFNDRVKNEFKAKLGKNIHIILPELIEESLDEVLDLGIGLEKAREEATKALKLDESLQRKLEKVALEELAQPTNALSLIFYSGGENNKWESKVVNLIFKDANISIKNKTSADTFEIEATISFKPKYEKSENEADQSLYGATRSNITVMSMYNGDRIYYPISLKKTFDLTYKKGKGFDITGSGKMYPDFPFTINNFY